MNCPRCAFEASTDQTTCQNCGDPLTTAPADAYAVPPGYPPMPPGPISGYQVPGYPMTGYPMPTAVPAPAGVGSLSRATVLILILTAVGFLIEASVRISGTGASVAGIATVTTLLMLVLTPVFIVWFFRIRRNAGAWGPQRRSLGWSIGGWFTPVLFLWFPFQIADDAWRASQPASAPKRGLALIAGWWTCWLLAWLTGVRAEQFTRVDADGNTTVSHVYGVFFGSTVASDCFAAAAAVLGALMVRSLGRWQEERIDAEAR
jgi:hypothetical protein